MVTKNFKQRSVPLRTHTAHEHISQLHAIPPRRSLEYLGSVSHCTNQKLFADIKERLIEDPHEELFLTVTSAGGPTGIAMCFFETVRHVLQPSITTIGIGDVDSSGIIIFLSGKKRLISRNTTLLLHLAGRYFDPATRFTAEEIDAMVQEDRLKDMQYATLIAECCPLLTPPEVLTMMKKNTVLSPQEALSLGLAHGFLS